jgi:lysyl-tRNA synthetase class 2
MRSEYSVPLKCELRGPGKVRSIRASGKRLVFIDLVQDDVSVQVMCNLGLLEKKAYSSTSSLERFRKRIRVGDYYGMLHLQICSDICAETTAVCTGQPSRTSSGELTLIVQQTLPAMLSPSLHTVPQAVTDEGTLARFPQLELLIRPKKRDLLRLRHHIELTMQAYFNDLDFTKVSTPVLAADTGGAAARPFETTANEFSETPLRLRIAQELDLKKLVAAGMGAVYEIGPVFRNEGLWFYSLNEEQ